MANELIHRVAEEVVKPQYELLAALDNHFIIFHSYLGGMCRILDLEEI
jgi:hypothetical protein